MKKLLRNLTLIALAAAATAFPSAVRADDSGDLDNINPYYHGGALMQHVHVSTLFMGRERPARSTTKDTKPHLTVG